MKKHIAHILALMLALCVFGCEPGGIAWLSAAQGEEKAAALNWKSIRGSDAYGQFNGEGLPDGFVVMESSDGTTFGEMNHHIINRNCWNGTCVYLARNESGQIDYIGILECADGKVEKAHNFYPNGDMRFMDMKTTRGLRYDNKGGQYTYAEWLTSMWGKDQKTERKNIPEWADIFYTDISVQIDETAENFQYYTVFSANVKEKTTKDSTDIYYVNPSPADDGASIRTRYYGVYTIDGVNDSGKPMRLLSMKVEKNGNVEIQWKNKTWSYDAEKKEYHPAMDQAYPLETAEDLSLCRQAADAGDAEAQYALGNAYLNGELVEQSYAEALKYFALAAEQNSGEAYLAMAKMYENAIGVEKDAKKAVEYYTAAVNLNNAEAQYIVGNAYYQLRTNANYAVYCLRLSARQLNPNALYLMAKMYETGDVLGKNPQLAFLYYVAAADNGCDAAQYLVGQKYYFGQGVEKSSSKALPYFERAAANGNADAQYYAGITYYFGEGEYPSFSKETYAKAAYYLKLSADQGNDFAQDWLGGMYASGTGVEQSYEQAAVYYALAAEQGYHTAQYHLGLLYRDGSLGAPDMGKAEEYLKKAADQKDRDACEALGDLFSDEAAGVQDLEQALHYYQLAANLGSKKAKNRIKELTGTN